MSDLLNVPTKNEMGSAHPEPTYGARHFTPRVDILETDRELMLFAEMPGVKPDDVDLRYENGELVLHGKVPARDNGRPMLLHEYENGDFYRVFRIDESVDATK